MRLRTSFFNWTIFKKNITRFFPAWLVYCVVMMLLTQRYTLPTQILYSNARELASMAVGAMSILNFLYAGILSLLLFGDLFKNRMCNALHALPLRRETWFFTHVISAFAMSFVPNLAITLLMLPGLAHLWFLAFVWLAVVTMEFICFFGLGALAVQCVGRSFAAGFVYTVLNFGVLLVRWVIQTLIVPMLYGVPQPEQLLVDFVPVVRLFQIEDLWKMRWDSACNCYNSFFDSSCRHARFDGFGDGWGYLWILLAVGVLALAGSLLLYRRRKLESAGDFVAQKPLKAIITVLGAVAVGLFLSLFGGIVLTLVGVLLGFFLTRMLLEHRVKVFYGKNWIRFAAMLVAFALFLALGWMDVLGIKNRIPELSRVESVTIADHYLTSYQLENIPPAPQKESSEHYSVAPLGIDPSYRPGNEGMLTLYDPALIEKVMQIHRLLLEEGDARNGPNSCTAVTVHYVLKNGQTITRRYYSADNSPAMQALKQFTNTPEYLLGVSQPEQLCLDLFKMTVYLPNGGYLKIPESWYEKFAQALFADASQGNLGNGKTAETSIEMEYHYSDGTYRYFALDIPASASHTWMCIKECQNEITRI